MIVHIVCFNIKATENSSKEENLTKMKELLIALPSKIKELNEMEVGLNFNPTEAAYDISIYSTFGSKEGLEAYNIHPEHLKVVDFIKTIATNRVVVDYEK